MSNFGLNNRLVQEDQATEETQALVLRNWINSILSGVVVLINENVLFRFLDPAAINFLFTYRKAISLLAASRPVGYKRQIRSGLSLFLKEG